MSNLYGKSKSKEIDWDKLAKYFPPKQIGPDSKEIPWPEDPNTIQWLLNYAENAKQREKEAKLYEKQHQEELRLMEEREKRHREESKQRQELNAKIPSMQAHRLSTGERYKCGGCNTRLFYFACCVNRHCPNPKDKNIESGIAHLVQENTQLKQEMSTSPSLDRKTFDRLNDFGKDGEVYTDMINRLLDIATATTEAKLQSTNNNEADAVLSRN
jgi:hypothetical protein